VQKIAQNRHYTGTRFLVQKIAFYLNKTIEILLLDIAMEGYGDVGMSYYYFKEKRDYKP
jgi:hypothetical protein